MIVDYKVYYLFYYNILYNDLELYATTNEVTSIVSEAIQNGTIEVKSSMFKSIETYKVGNNSTGITITGSGMVTIMEASDNVSNYYDRRGLISIDGITICPAKGDIYLFKSSLKIFTTNDTYSEIRATVGLFN